MSIQEHPSQSIIKTIGGPLSKYPPNIYGANSPTSGCNIGENGAYLEEEDGLGGNGGGEVHDDSDALAKSGRAASPAHGTYRRGPFRLTLSEYAANFCQTP